MYFDGVPLCGRIVLRILVVGIVVGSLGFAAGPVLLLRGRYGYRDFDLWAGWGVVALDVMGFLLIGFGSSPGGTVVAWYGRFGFALVFGLAAVVLCYLFVSDVIGPQRRKVGRSRPRAPIRQDRIEVKSQAEFRCFTCGRPAGTTSASVRHHSGRHRSYMFRGRFHQSDSVAREFRTSSHIGDGRRFEQVCGLLDSDGPDPHQLWNISRSLVPFYCYGCRVVYCIDEWRNVEDVFDRFDEHRYLSHMGVDADCPRGHQHRISD
ncbi:hypothetical protein ACIP5Y_18130 [Nocardia sp. NPDC088792]|uniref:hypothetical protein n=1 Tax=Nocardia sp. NPDC088792 TaxID=3364332 RepID=UPI00382D4588